MLKGIDPLLTPELLKVLAEMGHGDAIVIADANFTATTLGVGKPLVRMPGVGALRTAQAVLSLLPLDAGVACPASYMQVSDSPIGYRSAVQRTLIAALDADGLAHDAQFEAVERFAFYDRVRAAYAIVHTGEMQPYANFIFVKGVLSDPLEG